MLLKFAFSENLVVFKAGETLATDEITKIFFF